MNQNISDKGKKLLNLYDQMVKEGYNKSDGTKTNDVYNDFELRKFKSILKPLFDEKKIKSVLDYVSVGSNWSNANFDKKSGLSAMKFFNIEKINYYEPARNIDQRTLCDCVVCFDVLEHVFVFDLREILRDIFINAKKLVILNVACYEASALLPNGENAHVTKRPPMWWKGFVDSISIEFKNIEIFLICSTSYNEVVNFAKWKSKDWLDDPNFAIVR